jgi:hypothetical protein
MGQVLSFLEERLFFLKVYQGALLPGIPPIKLPKFIFKVYYSDLQPLERTIVEYLQRQRKGVWQWPRDVRGSSLCLANSPLV